MVSNKKLGKGLSSLLGNKADLNSENKKDNGLLLIPIEKIFRDENQPRKEFDKEKIEELAQSINKNGLIQPLILTKKDDNNYNLVAGERRWRAAQIANLKTLPALLLPTDLDKDEISLIENIQSYGQILPLEEIHCQMQKNWRMSQVSLKNCSPINLEKGTNFSVAILI